MCGCFALRYRTAAPLHMRATDSTNFWGENHDHMRNDDLAEWLSDVDGRVTELVARLSQVEADHKHLRDDYGALRRLLTKLRPRVGLYGDWAGAGSNEPDPIN